MTGDLPSQNPKTSITSLNYWEFLPRKGSLACLPENWFIHSPSICAATVFQALLGAGATAMNGTRKVPALIECASSPPLLSTPFQDCQICTTQIHKIG